MRCEEVRPILPELAEGGAPPAGRIQDHIAGCLACATELGQLRDVVLRMEAMRFRFEEPPAGFLGRVLTTVAEAPAFSPSLVRRVAGSERFQYAAFSLGGAVVGAGAIGLLWWRRSRRETSMAGA